MTPQPLAVIYAVLGLCGAIVLTALVYLALLPVAQALTAVLS